ncbi:hypothetical protein [Priestia megaterium]|uniref:hypothetical protein n=1 Tax=Priestia megaterium TaxID=1404 RepID=UPI002E1B2567|nr:hypothetical protein [Priestia megaterium]
MSGQTSRYGFRFQDLYLLREVFMDIANKKSSEITGTVHKERRFGVEARRPNTGTTDWDILVIDDEKHSVLEVKSGAVNPKDRASFWLRIREEIFQSSQTDNNIYPGLVINSDNLPSAFKAWFALSERTSFTKNNQWTVPLEPPKRVATEKQLINEALYWICSAKTAGVRKLRSKVSKKKALSVLLNFKLHVISGRELEQKIESMIERLTFITVPPVLRQQLEGWLSNCATSEVDEIHLFTLPQMFRQVKLLEKFLEQDPEVLRLAKLLKNDYTHNCLNSWKGKFTEKKGLQRRSLEEVQNRIFKIDWNTQQQSIALLADAGYGKSRTLYELYKQIEDTSLAKFEVVSLMSEDLVGYLSDKNESVLLNSLSLLVNLAVLNDKQLLLLVDGLDQIPKSERFLLSSLLHTVSQRQGFLSILTCRKVDWDEQGKLKESLQTWEQRSLTEWPETVVMSILKQYGISRNVSKGIKKLISIPLYLDIFIRVFTSPTTTEEYVQTRHGLLNAYWQNVILREQRIQRWNFLKEACEQISRKNYWVPSEGFDVEILESLLSSGLITRVNGRARYDFRHTLLRDFVMAQWILEKSEENPKIIGSIIGEIESSSIIQFGAHRALLEAISDVNESSFTTNCSIEDYVFYSKELEKEQIARVLGGLYPSEKMNIALWSKKPNYTFIDSLIRSAQLHLNREWTPIFASWPSSKIWVEQQQWIGKSTLERLATYFFVIADKQQDYTKEETQHIHLIGNTIIEWTKLEIFQSELRKNDSWLLMKIIPYVSQWASLELTITWLSEEITKSTWRTRHAALESLVILTSKVHAEKKDYYAVMGDMYCKLIGLNRNEKLPSLDKTIASDNMLQHYVVDWSLLGTQSVKTLPLIDQAPETFFPIILDFLFAMLFNEDYIPSYRRGLEVEIKPGKKLIDDQLGYFYWNSLYENDMEVALLKGVHDRLKNWLATKPEFLMDKIITFIFNSPLASIRILLIQLFLEEEKGHILLPVIKEIILDERIYHVRESYYWLFNTLKIMWEYLEEKEQAQVYTILLKVSKSPYINGEYVAGILLSCVPPCDCENLKSILKTFQEHGYPAIPNDPRVEVSQANWKDKSLSDNKRYILKAVGDWEGSIDQETIINLYELMNKLDNQNKPPSISNINNIMILLEQVLPAISESPNQIKRNSWLLRQLKNFLQSYKEISKSETNYIKLLPIQDKTISMIAEIATVLLQCSKLPETPEEFLKSESMMIPGDAWTQSLFLLDEVMLEDIFRNKDELFNVAYAQIKKIYSQALPYQQCLCILGFRAWHWFRTDKDRVKLLQEIILSDHTTGIALRWASTGIFNYFSGSQLDYIIRRLLTKKTIPFTDKFLNKVGIIIGGRAMLTSHKNEQLLAGKLIDDVISKSSFFPLLREEENEVEFLAGIVFGLKESALISAKDSQLVYEYGNWMLNIWELVSKKEHNQQKNLILFAMHWIVNPEKETKMSDLSVWWQSIYPLMKRVMIAGMRRDVNTVLFAVSRHKVEMIQTIEALELINLFVQRILISPEELDIINPEKDDWQPWRKIADYAAQVIQHISIRGNLTETEREQCYVLLNKLASQPISSAEAEGIIIRLQSDIE